MEAVCMSIGSLRMTIEIPYEDMGIFLGRLPARFRKQIFDLINQTYKLDITGIANIKPRKRLKSPMKITIDPNLNDDIAPAPQRNKQNHLF